jgi:hypothetical protein
VIVLIVLGAMGGTVTGPPEQPIAFDHSIHAGKAGIACEFCHRNVTKGAAATVPAVEQCVFCHQQLNPENLVGSSTANQAEMQRVVDKFNDAAPIDWERVHRLPDHVRFVHEAHLRFLTQGASRTVSLPIGSGAPMQLPLPTGEACSVCHGDVASMTEVQPQPGQSLKMGTCVDCHRELNVGTDCTICHK